VTEYHDINVPRFDLEVAAALAHRKQEVVVLADGVVFATRQSFGFGHGNPPAVHVYKTAVVVVHEAAEA
jgi:hypothetical protein